MQNKVVADVSKAVNDDRSVTSLIGIILMVAVTLIVGITLSVFALGMVEQLNTGGDQRVFADATVELGAEYRSWGGGGDVDNPDIDIIRLEYRHGPVFESDEIGSILIIWTGNDGQRGQLRFTNPSRFSDSTDQQYHDDDVGTVCTGEIRAGGGLTFRMVHNEFQSGGDTDPSDTIPGTNKQFGVRYVESGWNGIVTNHGPFFITENRYPVTFSGDRPIEPGDSVEIWFLGAEDELVLAKSSGTAREFSGTPTERDSSVFDC